MKKQLKKMALKKETLHEVGWAVFGGSDYQPLTLNPTKVTCVSCGCP
jgi:hypothetical protein